MALIEIKDPTKKDLQIFGILFIAFFGLLGGVLWWQGVSPTTVYTIWAIAAAIVAVYYAVPALQRKIYFGWLYAAYPIGFVISHVVMGVVYYLVVSPIALIMKAMGRDALKRKIEKNAKSYWEPARKRDDKGSYFRQF